MDKSGHHPAPASAAPRQAKRRGAGQRGRWGDSNRFKDAGCACRGCRMPSRRSQSDKFMDATHVRAGCRMPSCWSHSDRFMDATPVRTACRMPSRRSHSNKFMDATPVRTGCRMPTRWSHSNSLHGAGSSPRRGDGRFLRGAAVVLAARTPLPPGQDAEESRARPPHHPLWHLPGTPPACAAIWTGLPPCPPAHSRCHGRPHTTARCHSAWRSRRH